VFDPGQPTKVSVDAALVEISDRHPNDGYFSDVFSESQLNGAGMYCVFSPVFFFFNVAHAMLLAAC
jgi:hypothetical protein